MNRSFFHLIAIKIEIAILLGITVGLLFATPSYAQDLPGRQMTVSHSETGEEYLVTVPRASEQELSRWRPSQLSAEKINELFKASACAVGQTCAEAVREFPLSAAVFYGASFMVSSRQLLLSPSSDPVVLQNYFAQQIADPVSHLSFLAFTVAHKGSNEILQALATKYGWVRNSKAIHEFGALGAPPVSTSNKVFESAKMSIGLAAGFIASGIAGEFLHDEYVQHCFLSPQYGADKLAKEISRMGMTPKRACDVAYEHWVSTEKILDYAPDIVSAVITTAVLARAVPLLHHGLSKVGYVLRGLRFARVAGSFIPSARWVLMVENAYFFLELQHVLNPFFKDPFESWRKSNKIIQSHKNMEQAIQQSGLVLSADCKVQLSHKFSDEILKQTPTSTVVAYIRQKLPNCAENLQTPKQLVEHYMKEQQQWRGYWASGPLSSLSNWQKEMLSLQSNYQDAEKFYLEIVDYIRRIKSGKGNFSNKSLGESLSENFEEDLKDILKKYDLDQYDESYPGAYKLFKFKNRGDFFLTMMVCGAQYPEDVIQKRPGLAMGFFPPAVISEKISGAICNRLPMVALKSKVPGSAGPALAWDDWNGYGHRLSRVNATNGAGEVNRASGKIYDNLFAVLVDYIRPDLLEENKIKNFWATNVEAPVRAQLKEMQKNYSKVSQEIEKSQWHNEVVAKENIRLPKGTTPHLLVQIKTTVNWLEQLTSIKASNEDQELLQLIFATAQDEKSLPALTQLLRNRNYGDLLDLQNSGVDNAWLIQHNALSLATEVYAMDIASLFEKKISSFSGFQLEMSQHLLNSLKILLNSVPESQLYKLILQISAPEKKDE